MRIEQPEKTSFSFKESMRTMFDEDELSWKRKHVLRNVHCLTKSQSENQRIDVALNFCPLFAKRDDFARLRDFSLPRLRGDSAKKPHT